MSIAWVSRGCRLHAQRTNQHMTIQGQAPINCWTCCVRWGFRYENKGSKGRVREHVVEPGAGGTTHRPEVACACRVGPFATLHLIACSCIQFPRADIGVAQHGRPPLDSGLIRGPHLYLKCKHWSWQVSGSIKHLTRSFCRTCMGRNHFETV